MQIDNQYKKSYRKLSVNIPRETMDLFKKRNHSKGLDTTDYYISAQIKKKINNLIKSMESGINTQKTRQAVKDAAGPSTSFEKHIGFILWAVDKGYKGFTLKQASVFFETSPANIKNWLKLIQAKKEKYNYKVLVDKETEVGHRFRLVPLN